MESNERQNLVAPCGIDCGICELYTCKDDSQLYDRLIANGIPMDKIPCEGCRSSLGNCPVIQETCHTYTCVQKKNVDFCSDCDEFPCVYLHPSADRANVLPHNLKVYNLCKIKNEGLNHFIQQSAEIKARYYAGKMFVGKGPRL